SGVGVRTRVTPGQRYCNQNHSDARIKVQAILWQFIAGRTLLKNSNELYLLGKVILHRNKMNNFIHIIGVSRGLGSATAAAKLGSFRTKSHQTPWLLNRE